MWYNKVASNFFRGEARPCDTDWKRLHFQNFSNGSTKPKKFFMFCTLKLYILDPLTPTLLYFFIHTYIYIAYINFFLITIYYNISILRYSKLYNITIQNNFLKNALVRKKKILWKRFHPIDKAIIFWYNIYVRW